MSAATATILTAVTTAATAGGTVTGSVLAHKSANKAASVQEKSDAAQMAEAQARDAEAKREFEAQQAQVAKEWAAKEEQRQYDRALSDARQARLAPYRAASAAALTKLGGLLGIDTSSGGPATASASSPALAPNASAGQVDHIGMPTGGGPPVAPNVGMGLTQPAGMPATDPGYAPVNSPVSLGALLNLPKPAFDPRAYVEGGFDRPTYLGGGNQ